MCWLLIRLREGRGGLERAPETTIRPGQSRAWSGQHPGTILASKAKRPQPAQIDRGDPHRPPQVVALDTAVGHPPAAVSDQPGQRAFHHRPPAPVALLEAVGHRTAAGSTQLDFVGVDPDRAATLGGGAAPAERATLAPASEADLTRLGDRRLMAGRASDRAGLPVDPEVVDGEPTRGRTGQRDRLDRLNMASSAQRRAGRPSP